MAKEKKTTPKYITKEILKKETDKINKNIEYVVIRLDDVDKRPFGCGLRCCGRDEHCSVKRVEDEANFDETAGPEAMILVGNRGA